MSFDGRINVYVCESCGGKTVTKDVDEGVTPFMLCCRATLDCEGYAYSSHYRVDQAQPWGWEWFKPTPEEIAAKPEAHRDHYLKGGLDIREVPN